jgi:hypothetical protein
MDGYVFDGEPKHANKVGNMTKQLKVVQAP